MHSTHTVSRDDVVVFGPSSYYTPNNKFKSIMCHSILYRIFYKQIVENDMELNSTIVTNFN